MRGGDHGTREHLGDLAVGYRREEGGHGTLEHPGKCVAGSRWDEGIMGHWNTLGLELSGVGGRRGIVRATRTAW